MPGEAGDPTADSPWYGFDFGPIHFTVISTEHAFTPDSKQVKNAIICVTCLLSGTSQVCRFLQAFLTTRK